MNNPSTADPRGPGDALYDREARARGIDPSKGDANKGEPTSLIAGKYKTNEEATKGIHELIQAKSRAEDENRQLRERLDAVENASRGQAPGQGVEDEKALFRRLGEEAVIDPELLEHAVDRLVERGLTRRLEPALNLAKVDQAMLETYGREYLDDLPKLKGYIDETPRVKMFVEMAEKAGRPELGRQYAYEAWKHAQGDDAEKSGRDAAEDARDRRAAMRPHARIQGKGSRAHNASPEGTQMPSREQWNDALRDAQRGNWKSFDRVFIDPFLPSQEEIDAAFGR